MKNEKLGHSGGRLHLSVEKGKKLHLIPCDKDCYYQQQGYCTLDGFARITNFCGDGCGYFTQTDPYLQQDEQL